MRGKKKIQAARFLWQISFSLFCYWLCKQKINDSKCWLYTDTNRKLVKQNTSLLNTNKQKILDFHVYTHLSIPSYEYKLYAKYSKKSKKSLI